jgi:hypothetical protein
MKKSYFTLAVFLISLQYLTGCATIPDQPEEKETRLEKVKKKISATKQKLDAAADKYFPQVPDKILGKSFPGVRIGYAYDLKKQTHMTDKYLLLKIPMCAEKREQFISYTNRADNAAGVAAVLATPLVLSAPVLVDPLFFIEKGLAKSRNKTVEKTGTIRTGRVLLCGEKESAPGETLIIQSSGDTSLIYLQTDTQGQFDLHDIIARTGDSPYLNIFIKQDNASYYLSTIFTN